MNPPAATSRLLPAAAAVALAVLAFSLACRLTTDPIFVRCASPPLIGRLLGESRRALGGAMVEQADRYFHRGIGHARKRVPMGFIQRAADHVNPRLPEHLEGHEIDEIMPWLRMATRLNPRDVDAFLDAAFWVDARQGGRRDLALGILAEARRHNPGDYRIPMQRGRVLLRGGEVRAAARAFDAALAMWETTGGVDQARRELDRAALLDFRGFVHELEGDQAAALGCYRERARTRSGVNGSQAVIREIEEGRRSRRDAERQLAVLMGSAVDPDEQCRHDEDHGETHEHAHGAPAH